jgi:hypothetical protein
MVLVLWPSKNWRWSCSHSSVWMGCSPIESLHSLLPTCSLKVLVLIVGQMFLAWWDGRSTQLYQQDQHIHDLTFFVLLITNQWINDQSIIVPLAKGADGTDMSTCNWNSKPTQWEVVPIQPWRGSNAISRPFEVGGPGLLMSVRWDARSCITVPYPKFLGEHMYHTLTFWCWSCFKMEGWKSMTRSTVEFYQDLKLLPENSDGITLIT